MKKCYSLIEKILNIHMVPNLRNENYDKKIKIDQVYMEEHSAGNIFNIIDEIELKKLSCDVVACYCDHNSLTKEHEMEVHQYLKERCNEYGIYYEKASVGICHQLHLEYFAKPGDVILGANSHTSYCGGIGALSIGVGGIDIVEVLSGLNYSIPSVKIIGILIKGKLNKWCSAQDVGFEILRKIKLGGAKGKFIEFIGDGLKNLDIEERCVICQMCTEVDAITAIFPSDDITREYLDELGRKEQWKEIIADESVIYDEYYEINLNEIVPLIALPFQPDNVIEVENSSNIPIQQIIIGGCTSGTYKDIFIAADILSKLYINDNVHVIIQPASTRILRKLNKMGVIEKLLAVGAEITSPSCDACVGIVYIPSSGFNSMRSMSRNFIGRCGCKDANVYLAGSLTAAASAVNGFITNPKDFFNINIEKNIQGIKYIKNNINTTKNSKLIVKKSTVNSKGIEKKVFSNVLVKFERPISTDEIIPNGTDIKAKRDNWEEISKYLFYRIDSSIYEKVEKNKNYCIIAKENFGQGSARENAAIILRHVGVRFIIAESYYNIFRKNAINYGILPLYFLNRNDRINVDVNDRIVVENIISGVKDNQFIVFNESKKRSYECYSDLNEKEKEIILMGSLIEYIKKFKNTE